VLGTVFLILGGVVGVAVVGFLIWSFVKDPDDPEIERKWTDPKYHDKID